MNRRHSPETGRDFVALDLETANPNPWSICQIGVAQFNAGRVVEEWMTYIDPGERFNLDNVAVHGITSAAVQGWPRMAEVARQLRRMVGGRVVISHSGFDRIALEQAYDRLDEERLNCYWLDSSLVARRAWAGFSRRGFGLENLCRHLGYRYQRHDALADAKAAGVVVLAAMQQTGVDLQGWLRLVDLPEGEGPQRPIRPMSLMPHGVRNDASQQFSRPSNQVLSPDVVQLLAEGVSPGADLEPGGGSG